MPRWQKTATTLCLSDIISAPAQVKNGVGANLSGLSDDGQSEKVKLLHLKRRFYEAHLELTRESSNRFYADRNNSTTTTRRLFA